MSSIRLRSRFILLNLLILSACQPLSQPSAYGPSPISTRSPGPNDVPSQPANPNERRPEDYSESEVTSRTQSLTPQSGQVSPDGKQLLMRYYRERKVSFRDGNKAGELESLFMLLNLSSGRQQAVDMISYWRTELQVWEDSSHLLYAPPVIVSKLTQADSSVKSMDTKTGLNSERFKLAEGEVALSLGLNGDALYLLTNKGIQARQRNSGALLRSYSHPFPDFYSFFKTFQLLPGTRKALIAVEKDWAKQGTQPFKVQHTQPPLLDYYLLDLVSGDYTPVQQLRDSVSGPVKPVQVSPDGKFILLPLGQHSSILDLTGSQIAETESMESAWVSNDSVVTLYTKDTQTRLRVKNLRTGLTPVDFALSGTEPVLVESREGQILVQLTQNGQRVLQAYDLRQTENIPAPKTLLSFPADGSVSLINARQGDRPTSLLSLEHNRTNQTLYRWDPVNNSLVSLLDLKPAPGNFRYEPQSRAWHFYG